jgi:2-hydroxymuconate-semialdehyde hydrolase
MTQPETATNPEIGTWVEAGGVRTNVHDRGAGEPVVLLHGSGPGVSAWANWRLTIPALERHFRVIAPDIVGFGFTERPAGITYDLPAWRRHLRDLLDALGLPAVSLVGNSFGGALALSFAIAEPHRVRRLVLMGSVGLRFPITEELDIVWGYEPSIANMRRLLDIFVFNRELVSDDLAELRYRASIRPGVQEAYRQMFPAPRQRWVDALASPKEAIAALPHHALVIHGREDRVIPVDCSLRLFALLPRAELHVFGRCGHWTQIEHADRFNRLVADFLASGEEAEVTGAGDAGAVEAEWPASRHVGAAS